MLDLSGLPLPPAVEEQEPRGAEEPTAEESDPFATRLNKEQLAFVTLAMQQQEREEVRNGPAPTINPQALIAQVKPEVKSQLDEAIARGQELAPTVGSNGELRQALLDEGYPIPIVAQAMQKEAPF